MTTFDLGPGADRSPRGCTTPVDDLADGEEVTLDLSDAERGPVRYADADRIRVHPVATGKVGENGRYDAVVTREATGEVQTTRF